MSNAFLEHGYSVPGSTDPCREGPETCSTVDIDGEDRIFFRSLIRNLLRCKASESSRAFDDVKQWLGSALQPINHFDVLLGECVIEHRSKGMDIATDILSHFGDETIKYAWSYCEKDHARWEENPDSEVHHANDDVWYVLIRAVGLSVLNSLQKFPLLSYCTTKGSIVMREAGVLALSDVASADPGFEYAPPLLSMISKKDSSPFIRSLAKEELEDR